MELKVKVLLIGGTRVHGMHSYFCFLGTMFDKLIQNEHFLVFFNVLFQYNKKQTSIFSILKWLRQFKMSTYYYFF